MNMKLRNRKLILITVALVVLACTMWHMTVMAKGSTVTVCRDELLEMEEVYMENIRTKLELMGYHNAGITLTSVSNPDGTVEYTSRIHHKRIDRLSENERAKLQKELNLFSFQREHCKMSHEFLIYEE